MTILLVEDNPADVRFIREMLKDSPTGTFHVHHVARLDCALERLREQSFDVVLLDLGLPDAQGIQTLTLTQKVGTAVPIVVLTGLDDERVVLEAARAGAQDYLVKGRFDSQLLVRTIRYAIERKRTQEEIRLLNMALEQRVAERTAQLKIANEELRKEILERKRAEQRIAHLASFPELNPGIIFETDLDGKITYANPEARRRFPTLRESAPEHPLLNDWIAITASLARGAGRSTVREVEADDLVFLQTIYQPPELGVVRAYCLDITARKRAEGALEAQRVLLLTVVNHLPGAVMIAEGTDLRIRLVNPSYQLLAPDKTMVGRTLEEVWPEIGPRVPNIFRQVLATGEPHQVRDEHFMIRRSPDGPLEPACFSWSVFRVRLPGEQRWVLLNTAWETTQRKQAEDALRESEAQFRTLANAIPQLCWMANADGWIFWYNQRWYEYTGTTPEQMQGWGWQSVHDPEALPKVLERWKASIATGEPFDMVFPLRGADNVLRPFLTRVLPVRDTNGKVVRWFGTNTDVTELRNAQEALRASEQRWAITLQSIGDAVISTDASGKIVFMNEVAQKLTGWPLGEAKGRDLNMVLNLVDEVTRIKPENPVAKVIRSGEVVGLGNHAVLVRRDGKEIPIEDSGAPIRNKEGAIEGVVLVFHDVSEQRQAEKALRDSERLATTGKLAATLAHEINNPLDAVGNLLFMIEQATQEQITQKYVSMASQELERVAQMTQHMLSFQRESAQPVPVNIKDIVDNVLALYRGKIESGTIRIEKEIEFTDAILAHPGELRQAFANLIGNAIEAVPNGKIRLRAYASREWRNGRRGLRVVVADNGKGVPAEAREKIFEPFFTTKGEGGTGLGLWVTTCIMTKYQGSVRLRSTTRPGRSGTCFSLFFPIETRPAETPKTTEDTEEH